MERQLVAPTIDQWRAIQRERRAMAEQYRPYEQPHAAQSRNRQLLRITSDTPDEATGFYPAVWLQSDTSDQSHADQAEVWAWLIVGTGGEDAFAEGEHVGTHTDGTPVFRSWLVDEGFPDVLRVVTNVCPVGESAGSIFNAAENYEISTADGQAVIVGEPTVKAGIMTVRAVVDWTDPDYEAGTGDAFGFYLIADDADYTGAPVHLVTFVGNGASMQKEMVWNVPVAEDGPVELALWAYRASGSRSLVVATTSRLEVNSEVAGTKVEYRQIILSGALVGNKICVVNPRDCCIDDDASNQDSASDISVACCSVPIPAMRSVDLSGVVSLKPGWFAYGFGYYLNYDYLIDRVQEELDKLHYLPYSGTLTDTRVRCIYEKTIAIPDARVASYFGFPPTEETAGDIVYLPTFSIRIRFLISERLSGEGSPFFDWTTGESDPAGEYQAHCGLNLDYFTDSGPWAGYVNFAGIYNPHYSNEFYATQPEGVYPRLRSGGLPDPGTSCAGECNLYLIQGTLIDGTYEGESASTVIGHPLTVRVNAV